MRTDAKDAHAVGVLWQRVLQVVFTDGFSALRPFNQE